MVGLPAAPPPSPLPAPAAPVARAPVVRPAPVARFLRASAVGFRLDRGALWLGRGVARMGKAVAHVSAGATVTAGASDSASTVKVDRRATCSASKGPTPSKNAGPPVAARAVRGSRWGDAAKKGESSCVGARRPSCPPTGSIYNAVKDAHKHACWAWRWIPYQGRCTAQDFAPCTGQVERGMWCHPRRPPPQSLRGKRKWRAKGKQTLALL